jgi:hypothetical protein
LVTTIVLIICLFATSLVGAATTYFLFSQGNGKSTPSAMGAGPIQESNELTPTRYGPIVIVPEIVQQDMSSLIQCLEQKIACIGFPTSYGWARGEKTNGVMSVTLYHRDGEVFYAPFDLDLWWIPPSESRRANVVLGIPLQNSNTMVVFLAGIITELEPEYYPGLDDGKIIHVNKGDALFTVRSPGDGIYVEASVVPWENLEEALAHEPWAQKETILWVKLLMPEERPTLVPVTSNQTNLRFAGSAAEVLNRLTMVGFEVGTPEKQNDKEGHAWMTVFAESTDETVEVHLSYKMYGDIMLATIYVWVSKADKNVTGPWRNAACDAIIGQKDNCTLAFQWIDDLLAEQQEKMVDKTMPGGFQLIADFHYDPNGRFSRDSYNSYNLCFRDIIHSQFP